MRCTLFMLFCLVGMTFANDSYAQKTMVSLALEDRTVDEVLTELEQGTEFVFFYNNKQVDVNRRVSVQVNNKTIFKVLNDMFKGTNIGYKVLDRNIILYDKAVGAEEVQATMQAITVKGTVADATGEPIIGASILVKGTSNGVITDIDGNFTLSNVAPTATLLVSYVGYKTQEIRVDGKTSFNIVLAEDAEVLDEVVVVGYGVQKKQSLTGAVTAITSETIQTTKSENLINNIQGKMPGLMIRQKTGEPGTFDNMISIRGGGEPLIVIDGVTREYEEFAQLNSEDIENISILKDASAAIYGMNSANGVIIVTTKQGASEKTRVSYSGLFGIKHATGMEETVDAYTFRMMENEMSRNGKKAEVYSQDILDKYKNGVEGYRDWDWIDMYMNKQAFATNHTLSIRGGNEKVKYFVSAGWRMSEEKFIKEGLPFVSNLKLRASYGKSGYDAGDPFQYVAAYTQGEKGYVFNDKLTMGMVAPGVVLDNLSWVVTKTANIGVDFDLWNGKLFGTVEVYRRVNDGILASRIMDIPNTFGASFPKENINSEENTGFEIELGTRGKIGKDFGYTISANYSFTRYKFLDVEHNPYQSSMDRFLNGHDNRTIGGMWDHSGGGMWIQKTDGQFQNISEFERAPLYGGSNGNSMMLPGAFRIIDRNGDGVIGYEDQLPESRRAGANPPYQFGMNLGFTYKNFDLNILLQGAAGYVIGYANDDVFGYGSKTNPTLMKKYMDRWHTANVTDDPYNPATQWVSGKFPALRRDFVGTQDNGNSWGVGAIPFWNPNATYLRLKSLELGYTLPKNLTRKVGISDLRVFVNGFNLLTFCNSLLKDADPEREERDWGASLAYPLMKSYNIGLNINF